MMALGSTLGSRVVTAMMAFGSTPGSRVVSAKTA